MPNKILKTLIKKRDDRKISELLELHYFLIKSSPREFRFYQMCENFFNKEDKTIIYN